MTPITVEISDSLYERLQHEIALRHASQAELIRDALTQYLEDTVVERPSILDVLSTVDGKRGFQTAAEVDAHISQERASWER